MLEENNYLNCRGFLSKTEQFRSATGTNPDCFMRLFNYLNQGDDCSNIKFYGTSKRLLEEKYTNSEEVKCEKNTSFLTNSFISG